MALAPWRLNLQPASFRGAGFHVDADAKSGGRRYVEHEFVKADLPSAEDMGRRARKFRVTCYLISGPLTADYRADRDALIAALETEGSGQLVHPTMGVDQVQPGAYTVTEQRERGGWCSIEMEFAEAGQTAYATPGVDTQSAVSSAAVSSSTNFQSSSDITSLYAAG